jgi:hypothetical protein
MKKLRGHVVLRYTLLSFGAEPLACSLLFKSIKIKIQKIIIHLLLHMGVTLGLIY